MQTKIADSLLDEMHKRLAKITVGSLDRPLITSAPNQVTVGMATSDIMRLHVLLERIGREIKGPRKKYEALSKSIVSLLGGSGPAISVKQLLSFIDTAAHEPGFRETVVAAIELEEKLIPLLQLARLTQAAYDCQVRVQFPALKMRPFAINCEWQVFYVDDSAHGMTAGLDQILRALGTNSAEVVHL